MSSMIGFFMGFHIDSSDDKVRSDKVIISNHVRQILGILDIFLLSNV